MISCCFCLPIVFFNLHVFAVRKHIINSAQAHFLFLFFPLHHGLANFQSQCSHNARVHVTPTCLWSSRFGHTLRGIAFRDNRTTTLCRGQLSIIYCVATPYAWNGRRRVVHGILMFSFVPSVIAIAKLVGAKKNYWSFSIFYFIWNF